MDTTDIEQQMEAIERDIRESRQNHPMDMDNFSNENTLATEQKALEEQEKRPSGWTPPKYPQGQQAP
jgi:hypothetical protein